MTHIMFKEKKKSRTQVLKWKDEDVPHDSNEFYGIGNMLNDTQVNVIIDTSVLWTASFARQQLNNNKIHENAEARTFALNETTWCHFLTCFLSRFMDESIYSCDVRHLISCLPLGGTFWVNDMKNEPDLIE